MPNALCPLLNIPCKEIDCAFWMCDYESDAYYCAIVGIAYDLSSIKRRMD